MVGAAAVKDLAGEVEDTLLAAVAVTDSGVVTHLADSPAAALVRDSREENPISRAQALVISHFTMAASTTASLLMTVSYADTIHRFVSNFAFVGFGFPDWDPNYDGSYPDDYSNNDGEPGYDDQYLDESSAPTQSELARRANYPPRLRE